MRFRRRRKAASKNGTRPTGEASYSDTSGMVHPADLRIFDGARAERDLIVSADVCVIGTGAGGAVVAKELSEAGLEVVMLEDGAYFTTDDYTARPREMSVKLYRDQGQIATTGVPPILLPMGRAVGGTTLINSGTCFRTPPAVLEMWGDRFGLDGLSPWALDPYFRRVERELNVSQTPEEIAGRNAAIVKRGADALGYSGDFVYRNVRGCVGSGVCNFGCPTSAKQHVGATYVPKAWSAGARTFSATRARGFEVENRRLRAVDAVTGSGRRLRVECETAVMAAGSIHTPLLMRRAGLKDGSGQMCRNLSIHPAAALRALMDERVSMWDGVPQSYYIDEFADEGIMLEGAAGPPDYLATSLPYVGERHRRLMTAYPNISQFGIMVSDSSRGRVIQTGSVIWIRYNLNRSDTLKFKRAFEVLADIYWAAGAKRIFTPIAGLPELGEADMNKLRNLDLEASQLTLIGFHPLGTCRMSADPNNGPVDPAGKLRGYEGIYVADGSIVPSSLGVNPQITIMALATKIAYGLAGKPPPADEPAPQRIARPRVSVAHL